MNYLREDLKDFDMMVLWAYLVIRGQSNQSSIWVAEGGEA